MLDPEKDYPTLTMKRGKNATATVTLNAKAKQHGPFFVKALCTRFIDSLSRAFKNAWARKNTSPSPELN